MGESAMNLLTIGPHADAWKLVAESLVFVPTEAIDAALSPLTSVATLDIIKFMVTLFLAIPLGLVARFVPLGAARHLYNFGIGIFYAQMCYGPGWPSVLLFVGRLLDPAASPPDQIAPARLRMDDGLHGSDACVPDVERLARLADGFLRASDDGDNQDHFNGFQLPRWPRLRRIYR